MTDTPWRDDFAELVGLASDILTDQRDIDALIKVAEAIALRQQLDLGGAIGALGPVELAWLCDRLGGKDGREVGVKLLKAARSFVRSPSDATVMVLEEALDQIKGV